MSSSGQSRIIVDVEITTWPGTWERCWGGPNEKREIVQIGAVRFDPQTFAVLDTFEVLVRPTHNPQLSALFTELTGITQAQVDAHGLTFAEAFTRFAAFRGDRPLHSYGGHRFGGDTSVFAANFEYNNMPKPAGWPNNEQANLKPWFVRHAPETETANSGKLVKVLGLREPEGEHTGLADCLSILTSMQHLVQARGCPRPYSPS
jgi:inhibitor of KinA sporulation pathway (predicted exonuclease)